MRVDDPVVELHASALYKRLRILSADLADRVTGFVSQISPILATTVTHFPFYTRHDAHHGFRVTKRIAQVIETACLTDDDPRSLTATEIFLLIAASYAHDLGMTVFPTEEDALLASLGMSKIAGWETDPRLQQHLRQYHSIRGIEYLREKAAAFQIPINLLSPLDWLMRSHNMSISELERALQDPFAAEEKVTDIRQLSIILCIADSVEFSDTRVIDGVVEKLVGTAKPDFALSYRENMKHVCIGDSLAIDENGRLVVSGSFSESDVLSLAHHTFDQMEKWIAGYCEIDRRSAVHRLRIRPELFARRLELFGARFERLGVRISKKNVIDLISSNAVWSSTTGATVKELLQNSIEACRYRRFHSSEADDYVGSVTVDFDRNSRTITIQDNGCGMSERTVLEHLLTVGNSRATERAYATNNYFPIARFGIGFWSVFTIASKAHVETAAFESGSANKGVSFDVELNDLKDYTVFLDKEMSAGTKVVLNLKDEVIVDDLFQQSRNQLLCSEITVTFKLDGEVFLIPDRLPTVTEEKLLGTKVRLKREQDIRVFDWVGELDETELRLTLLYRLTESGTATFSMADGGALTFLLDGIGFAEYAICGFRVSLPGIGACFDVSRVGRCSVNRRTPKGFEFSLNRTSLISNESAQDFARVANKLLHEGYRAFLKETNSYTARDIFRLNQESRKGGGEVVDVFTGESFSHAAQNFPDLTAFELHQIDPSSQYPTVSPTYVDINGLKNMTGQVICSQNFVIWGVGQSMRYLKAEQVAPLVYEISKLGFKASENLFVAPPTNEFSLLFDADPSSTARPLDGALPISIALQQVRIENLCFDEPPQNILCQVQGRWTGTIYLRTFTAAGGKPYMFLGRHRVLVKPNSPLHSCLEGLKREGRNLKIAETVALVKEDEEGFTSDLIRDLVVTTA